MEKIHRIERKVDRTNTSNNCLSPSPSHFKAPHMHQISHMKPATQVPHMLFKDPKALKVQKVMPSGSTARPL